MNKQRGTSNKAVQRRFDQAVYEAISNFDTEKAFRAVRQAFADLPQGQQQLHVNQLLLSDIKLQLGITRSGERAYSNGLSRIYNHRQQRQRYAKRARLLDEHRQAYFDVKRLQADHYLKLATFAAIGNEPKQAAVERNMLAARRKEERLAAALDLLSSLEENKLGRRSERAQERALAARYPLIALLRKYEAELDSAPSTAVAVMRDRLPADRKARAGRRRRRNHAGPLGVHTTSGRA